MHGIVYIRSILAHLDLLVFWLVQPWITESENTAALVSVFILPKNWLPVPQNASISMRVPIAHKVMSMPYGSSMNLNM